MSAETTIGKYELTSRLAVGGMAEVYLAKVAGPGGFEKTVVVKRILPQFAREPNFVKMFLSEARLAAQLNHPNVVQVFDFGEFDGRYFLVMEHLDGPSLRRLIKHVAALGEVLPFGLAARLIASACEGLAYAHEFADPRTGEPLKLVHRDVSPDNIIATANGSVKVLDFGIAKVANNTTQLTAVGAVKGKFNYMAPEQARGEPLDRRADVFALGLVLYELVTGHKPYDSTNEQTALNGILFSPFYPLSRFRPDAPAELQRLLDRALAKDRAARTADCRELQTALEQFIVSTGQPVSQFHVAQLVQRLGRSAAPSRPGPAPAVEAPRDPTLELKIEVTTGGVHVLSAPPPEAAPAGRPSSLPAREPTLELRVEATTEVERRAVPAQAGASVDDFFASSPSGLRAAPGFGPAATPSAHPALAAPAPSAPALPPPEARPSSPSGARPGAAPLTPSAPGQPLPPLAVRASSPSGARPAAPPPSPSAPGQTRPTLAVRASSPSGRNSTGATRLAQDLFTVEATVPAALVRQHMEARAKLGFRECFGAVTQLAIAHTDRDQAAWGQAHAAALEVSLAFGGVVDGVDPDSVTAIFPGDPPAALVAATRAALELRDRLAEHTERPSAAGASGLRVAVSAGPLTLNPAGCVTGPCVERARLLLAKLAPGQIAVERAFHVELSDVTVMRVVDGAEHVLALGRRSRRTLGELPLLGRDEAVDAIKKRLSLLVNGVGAPLVVRGPRGAGRSALAEDLASRSRLKGLAVGVARAGLSLRHLPFGGITEVLCDLLGVDPAEWRSALRPALGTLGLAPDALAGALATLGLAPLPGPMTPGQVAVSLRACCAAAAGQRPLVLIFDGVEAMDPRTVEVIRHLATHLSTRELVAVLTDASVPDTRLGVAASLELQPLTPADVRTWATAALDAAPRQATIDALARLSGGWPAALVEWTALLDELGLLREREGGLTLASPLPDVAPAALTSRRVGSAPLALRRLLEAGLLVGETFSAAELALTCPVANATNLTRAVAEHLARPRGERRWSLWSPAIEAAVANHPSDARTGMHLRRAEALLAEQGTLAESARLRRAARHLGGAGEHAAAARTWQLAADRALADHAPLEVLAGLRGLVEAKVAANPAQGEETLGLLDALARAASVAFAHQDSALARRFVDQGLSLAARDQVTSGELLLASARLLRGEGRAKAAQVVLQEAATQAAGTPLLALIDAERGEALEQDGAPIEAAAAFTRALGLAHQAVTVAAWHGDVDLPARLRARLGGLSLGQQRFDEARQHFEASLVLWRAAEAPSSEARVLANLGTTAILARDPAAALPWFSKAIDAAERAGDLVLRARMLIQSAKALRLAGRAAEAKAQAAEARRVAAALDWAEGVTAADAAAEGSAASASGRYRPP